MVELLRTVIVNVLESLESGDGYRTPSAKGVSAKGVSAKGVSAKGVACVGRDRTGNGNGKWVMAIWREQIQIVLTFYLLCSSKKIVIS